MTLVDTPSPKGDRFIRTPEGKIDFEAYEGKSGSYDAGGGLVFNVEIKSARQRFGHLDLLVTPAKGKGERWVEFKNINLFAFGETTWSDVDTTLEPSPAKIENDDPMRPIIIAEYDSPPSSARDGFAADLPENHWAKKVARPNHPSMEGFIPLRVVEENE
jgi:hypothetical protein